MIYEIYFVVNEFKELFTDSLINELIMLKDDEFNNKQMSYFFKKISKEEIYKNLTDNLSSREDVIIDEDIVIFKNQVTGCKAKLSIGEDNCVYINTTDTINPIIMSLSKEYNILLHEIN